MTNDVRLLTRRDVLYRLGAVGGAAAVYHGLTTFGLLPVPEARAAVPGYPSDIGKGRKVIVIGAGLAGVCAAYLLAGHGFETKVIEANSRAGGRSLTLRKGDSFAEVGGPVQTCAFTNSTLYLNAGPGRIPQHHYIVLDYCSELGVELQPYIFMGGSNLLQSDSFLGGRPVPMRQAQFSLRGEISELLSKVAQKGKLDEALGHIDRERFLQMLSSFGQLQRSPDGRYRYDPQDPSFLGFPWTGYAEEPGAGLDAGQKTQRIPLDKIVRSDIWSSDNQLLFNNLQYYWQSSLLQPSGGMDMIWKAFLKQGVPGGKTVGDLIILDSPVKSLRNTATGVEVIHGDGVVDSADFCVSTMAPIQLVRVGKGLSTSFVNALADIAYEPATKVGWETKNRFWETKDRIYGGISFTDDIISQIWYPSEGFHQPTGVLTAAYNRGDDALAFGKLPIGERFELALQGGEKIHPGDYRRNINMDTALAVAWQNMPHFIGGWANDTWETRPTSYKRLNQADPEGQIYLAGDFLSYWPGWQEGALGAAELAFKQIAERVTKG
ncbi:MAG: FAD-dependent oxidoreductase [Proteobacteria bacterium]|nr:FAD-dependent oxidoreductase [Pseudomonadota bacterium]